MKQLTCEMCGGTDMIKKDGVFVCQSCGTKYSVEEAKKLMIEGPVEVTGTVKIDSAESFNKALKNARGAKEEKNWNLATKYYEEVRNIDPENWEAIFYNNYSKSMDGTIGDIPSSARSLSNCLKTVIRCVQNHLPENEKQPAVEQMSKDIKDISELFCFGAMDYYNNIDKNGISGESYVKYFEQCMDMLESAAKINTTFADELEAQFGTKEFAQSIIMEYYKLGITQMYKTTEIQDSNAEGKDLLLKLFFNRYNGFLYEISEKIKKYDPEYKLPDSSTFLSTNIKLGSNISLHPDETVVMTAERVWCNKEGKWWRNPLGGYLCLTNHRIIIGEGRGNEINSVCCEFLFSDIKSIRYDPDAGGVWTLASVHISTRENEDKVTFPTRDLRQTFISKLVEILTSRDMKTETENDLKHELTINGNYLYQLGNCETP